MDVQREILAIRRGEEVEFYISKPGKAKGVLYLFSLQATLPVEGFGVPTLGLFCARTDGDQYLRVHIDSNSAAWLARQVQEACDVLEVGVGLWIWGEVRLTTVRKRRSNGR